MPCKEGWNTADFLGKVANIVEPVALLEFCKQTDYKNKMAALRLPITNVEGLQVKYPSLMKAAVSKGLLSAKTAMMSLIAFCSAFCCKEVKENQHRLLYLIRF